MEQPSNPAAQTGGAETQPILPLQRQSEEERRHYSSLCMLAVLLASAQSLGIRQPFLFVN